MLDQTEVRFREARERENQEIRQIGEEHYMRVRTILDRRAASQVREAARGARSESQSSRNSSKRKR